MDEQPRNELRYIFAGVIFGFIPRFHNALRQYGGDANIISSLAGQTFPFHVDGRGRDVQVSITSLRFTGYVEWREAESLKFRLTHVFIRNLLSGLSLKGI